LASPALEYCWVGTAYTANEQVMGPSKRRRNLKQRVTWNLSATTSTQEQRRNKQPGRR